MTPELPRHGIPGEFLLIAARALLRPRISKIPELLHFAFLWTEIYKEDLALLENLPSAGIRGIPMGEVK